MEYSEIAKDISSLSYLMTGTTFVESLTEFEKWRVYERFKQEIQTKSCEEYEEAIRHATDILEL